MNRRGSRVRINGNMAFIEDKDNGVGNMVFVVQMQCAIVVKRPNLPIVPAHCSSHYALEARSFGIPPERQSLYTVLHAVLLVCILNCKSRPTRRRRNARASLSSFTIINDYGASSVPTELVYYLYLKFD